MPTDTPKAPAQPPPETIKDTLISIMIAFTMAFVFRGYVIEAFVIPTGSMAPTLMGAYIPLRGQGTGYSWPVGAYKTLAHDSSAATSVQPAFLDEERRTGRVDLQDPISGELIPAQNRRTYSGDRILVLKYLYGLRDPARFECIVFKNPYEPGVNFIKRLIGLPGEQIALADGDVFVRTDPPGAVPTGDDPASRAALWNQSGWRIARKDPVTQRTVWQLVYDTTFTPTAAFSPREIPWVPSLEQGWSMTAREYTFDGPGPAALVFDQTRQRSSRDIRGPRGLRWAIDDYYPYDEPMYEYHRLARFPVSDLRLRCGFRPTRAGQTIGMLLSARGHEFRATIGAGARIEVQEPQGAAGIRAGWKSVATESSIPPFAFNTFTNVEFCHVDQSVQIWLDGKEVLRYDYDWSPAERLRLATGQSLQALLEKQGNPQIRNELANPSIYKPCEVRFEFGGGPFTLCRVALDRDLHYQAAAKSQGGGLPALGTSPFQPLFLGPDQFFACGDNSPASADGRLWETVDPWVHALYPPPGGENSPHPSTGVVPRDLLLGRAFFVYWPSLKYAGSPVPVPDFGRMRFIW